MKITTTASVCLSQARRADTELLRPVVRDGLRVCRGGESPHWLGGEARLHGGRELRQSTVQGWQVLLCGQVTNGIMVTW